MVIDRFNGPYAFLSNFYPCVIFMDGDRYNSVEHAFQAAKTLDPQWREQIRNCRTPGGAKRLGREVSYGALLRPDWHDTLRLEVMRDLVTQKFTHPGLRRQLLATGTATLMEGNTWGDTFWGVYNGVGANHLGKILMEVRGENPDLR